MSRIIYERFKEIAPSKKLRDSMMIEVESWVSATFNEVNYTPKNLKKAMDEAWHTTNVNESISDFVYRVWRIDS